MTEFLQEYGKIKIGRASCRERVCQVTAMFTGLFRNFFESMGQESGLKLPEFQTGK